MLDFSVTFIITIINIAVLFFILRAVLFKPVTKFMADRAKRVQDSIDLANFDKAKAKELLAQYEQKLKEAEADAQVILDEALDTAAVQARRLIDESKIEAKHTVDAANRQIEAEKQAAMAKFKLEAAALIVAASEKLAARDFSGEDDRRYANMLLEGLSDAAFAERIR